MKRFIQWLKSPASDFSLFVILLILINLVGGRAFLRLDLTAPKSYSLSPASRQLVKTLDKSVTVQVFFSEGLPAPYNSIEQYLRDILAEYKGASKGRFSYSFFDMTRQENQQLASSYGLQQVQIQQYGDSEVGFKQVWMGAAILYADAIQTLDSLTTSDGFEYKLTTAISKMISTTDTLSALPQGKTFNLTLYLSEDLKGAGIMGMSGLEKAVQAAYDSANKKNGGRLAYTKTSPSAAEVPELAAKYGLSSIPWQSRTGEKGVSTVGLVLEYEGGFKQIPLAIQNVGFGYILAGVDKLEQAIDQAVESFISSPSEIGYVTGHQEPDLENSNSGAAAFKHLVADTYSFKPLDLAADDIPANMSTVVVNGPRTPFTETELYKLDQFLMKGGNLMFFVDPFLEQANQYTRQVQYQPNDTGLAKLFDAWGLTLGKDYILDESCYKTTEGGYGLLSLNWAPMVQKKYINQKHPVSKNLGYVIFFQNGSIDTEQAEKNPDLQVTKLVTSSNRSWLMKDNIMLNPMMITPPSDPAQLKPQNLAVLVEGTFTSAFTEAPAADTNAGDTVQQGTQDSSGTVLSVSNHIAKGVRHGRIFITASSAPTTQLIDDQGQQPVAILLRNATDYLNGHEELCQMRTKGLSLSSIEISSAASVVFAKYFNQFGLALLTALAGLLVWQNRNKRRRRIHARYNPDDERDITTMKKEGTK